jgi:uncharacterized protein YecE (DUF72 family)
VGRILLGTASWTDPSLAREGWYPPEAKSAEDRLRYYASRFPIVEVDSTYYFLPSDKNASLWLARTPDSFIFNIKAFSLLTGHPTKVEALPPGLTRPSGARRVYATELEPTAVEAVWEAFTAALEPLAAAGRLGAVLFQFPPWFGISRANKLTVIDCARRLDPLRIAVELRNASWFSEQNRTETLDFLEGHDLPFVCVDMPQGFASSVPPLVAATSDLAMVRFHGRNTANWEKGTVQTRYQYDYDQRELEEWVPRVRELEERSEETHVLMNNHGHHAPRNADHLARLLRQAGSVVVGPAGSSAGAGEGGPGSSTTTDASEAHQLDLGW